MRRPELVVVEQMVNKNLWLTRIRWTYSLFIFLFFSTYNILSPVPQIGFYELFLIVSLSIIGNFIFLFALKRNIHGAVREMQYNMFLSIAGLQLDLDFIVLALLVFFSGGFDSPVIVLFIFYIMVSTFLIFHKKAFRNTILAIILITIIFFRNSGFDVSSHDLARMVAFNIILAFTYFLTLYLTSHLKGNEIIMRELLEKTQRLSVTDGLTGLYNQTYFFGQLDLFLKTSQKDKRPFSVIIFDVDHFKNYNDNNGHIKGSEALAQIGVITKRVFRQNDIQAKYGGDEFVIILPNTDKVGAFLAADRLRDTVENETFPGEERQPMGRITLSVGVSSFPDHGETSDEILEKADKAMYYAKEQGRNRTQIYSDDMFEEDE